MVERERRDKSLGREPGPAAEEMMQVGGCDADRLGNLLHFGLAAPMLRNKGDCAPHEVVIGSARRRMRGNWLSSSFRGACSVA